MAKLFKFVFIFLVANNGNKNCSYKLSRELGRREDYPARGHESLVSLIAGLQLLRYSSLIYFSTAEKKYPVIEQFILNCL